MQTSKSVCTVLCHGKCECDAEHFSQLVDRNGFMDTRLLRCFKRHCSNVTSTLGEYEAVDHLNAMPTVNKSGYNEEKLHDLIGTIVHHLEVLPVQLLSQKLRLCAAYLCAIKCSCCEPTAAPRSPAASSACPEEPAPLQRGLHTPAFFAHGTEALISPVSKQPAVSRPKRLKRRSERAARAASGSPSGPSAHGSLWGAETWTMGDEVQSANGLSSDSAG
eukprot:Rhum_TRINITY_DN5453_c0_g10::Rhum_TRINITY_DN5453_c0_g10_i1::g.17534::m.17534